MHKSMHSRGLTAKKPAPYSTTLATPLATLSPLRSPPFAVWRPGGRKMAPRGRIDKWSFGRSRWRVRVFAPGRPRRPGDPPKVYLYVLGPAVRVCTCCGRPRGPKTTKNEHERTRTTKRPFIYPAAASGTLKKKKRERKKRAG